MRWLRRRASLVILLAVVCGTSAGSYWLSVSQIARSQHDWCQTLDLLTSRPVPRPADPAANPSREQTYILYSDFLDLRHRLGCG